MRETATAIRQICTIVLHTLSSIAIQINNYKELTADIIDEYRNTGGFDIIGSIMISNIESFEFRKDKDFCPYSQIQVDGVKRKGVYFIKNPEGNIPPVFHDINWNTNEVEKVGWEVMRTASSLWEKYDPLKNYTICYKDKGEEYFDKKMYDEVISYYKEQNFLNTELN